MITEKEMPEFDDTDLISEPEAYDTEGEEEEEIDPTKLDEEPVDEI